MTNTTKNLQEYQHPFHILSYSFLPMCAALFAGGLALLTVMRLHNLGPICSPSVSGLASCTLSLDFYIIVALLGILCVM